MIEWGRKKLIVLDRDGVINFDSDQYIKSEDEWVPIPGSLAAIASFNQLEKKVAIATNQSGIARGMYTELTLAAMHRKMKRLLAEHNGHIDKIYFCPHHPSENCRCRKPNPWMLEQAARDFDMEPSEMLFVGDSLKDWQAAENFGCDFVLVLTGKGEDTLAGIEPPAPFDVFDDLESLLAVIDR